jgi:hypothetical protein
MKKPAIFFALILSLVLSLAAEEKVFLQGKILDRETREPLPAYVMVGEGQGVSADAKGFFRLAVPPPTSGKIKVTVWFIGYRKKEVEAEIGKFLTVELDLEPLPAREVTVTADSVVSDDGSRKTVSLTKMDIYTLPGTAADPLYASHILPGVNAPPDASSLLIRGGAPDEVAYFFDGIEIKHPFLSESLHESYFSIFDNQIIERFTLATSGFPPKFGDALSGLMDLQAKGSPAKAEGGLGLSVLGLNSYAGFPVKGLGSFVGSYNRGFSDVLTWLNSRGGEREFKTEQAFGKFTIKANSANEICFEVLSDRYDYSQTQDMAFSVSTQNRLAALAWTSTPSRNLAIRTLVALSRYDVSFDQPGVSWVKNRDDDIQSRLDILWDLNRHFVEFGADFERRTIATFLADEDGPDYSIPGTRLGFYVHDKFQLSDKIYINFGSRLSTLSLLRRGLSFDPRLSAAFLLSKRDTVRFSAGIYHQFGDYSILRTNPDLRPKSAFHLALSYDRISDNLEVRTSVYDKEYRSLFLEDSEGHIENGGRGYACGAEFFIKIKKESYEALLVYNFLHSRRKENDVSVLAPSPYEIPHSATGIFTWKFKKASLGLRYSIASGRPVTPLVGREWDSDSASYVPVWGAPYSSRYPVYQRMDLNGTLNFHLFGHSVVAYFGITNLLGSKNILRYDYGEDYAGRQDQQSIFGRAFFAGIYIPFF